METTLRLVIEYMLAHLDGNEALRTRLEIAMTAINKLPPWDVRDIMPVIFYGGETDA